MVNARAYALVALCATICLWSYWRVALHPASSQARAHRRACCLGSIGLLYSHYLGALLLPVARPISSALRSEEPALVAARCSSSDSPAWSSNSAVIRFSSEGLNTVISEDLVDRILPATGMISHLLRYMTNGVIDPSPPFSELLLLTAPLVLVIITIRRLWRGKGLSAFWLLVFTFAALLSLMILINEVARVIVDNRIRYLMPLWPLTALMAGAGIRRLARRFRQVVSGLLALWLILGVHLSTGNDFRYDLGFFFRSDIHRVYRVLIKQVPETELLMIDKAALWTDRKRRLYSNLLDQNFNAIVVDEESLIDNIWRTWVAYPSFWLLYVSQDGAFINDLAASLGLVHCELVLDEWGFTLVRLARSGARCASDARHIEFENNIRLIWSGISLSDELLHFEAGLRSADDYLLASYSLAVHIIDSRSGERVAQGDVGVGPGRHRPADAVKSTSARCRRATTKCASRSTTGRPAERLPARDLETDEVSDIHTLHRFRLD